MHDTVLASAPPEPAFVAGERFMKMMASSPCAPKMTPEMVEKFKSDTNWNFVDTGVVVGSHTRGYGRNIRA
jgi:hypothetical protein